MSFHSGPYDHYPDHHHGGHHRRHRLSYGYPFVYGSYAYGYPYAYGGYSQGYPEYSYDANVDYGWIDTDVDPEQAEVYLDGEYVGVADDFDGYPEYLAIPTGRHTVEFVLDGYKIYRLNVDVRPGMTIHVGRSLSRRARPY